jgi:tetratricopeptide (TPR) repeat protein
MEKSVVGMLFTLAALVLISSCGAYEPVTDVLSGNFYVATGDYPVATLDYFHALANKNTEGWVRYNLGNVYDRLGEPDYAITELSAALSAGSPELLFRAHFNLGNIYFEKGELDSAFDQYREALRLRPASADAKKNIEITVRKIETEEHRRASSVSGETRMTSEVQQTLRNAQDKEVYVWKPADSNGGGIFQKDW